jgi:hypothetical protein
MATEFGLWLFFCFGAAGPDCYGYQSQNVIVTAASHKTWLLWLPVTKHDCYGYQSQNVIATATSHKTWLLRLPVTNVIVTATSHKTWLLRLPVTKRDCYGYQSQNVIATATSHKTWLLRLPVAKRNCYDYQSQNVHRLVTYIFASCPRIVSEQILYIASNILSKRFQSSLPQLKLTYIHAYVHT